MKWWRRKNPAPKAKPPAKVDPESEAKIALSNAQERQIAARLKSEKDKLDKKAEAHKRGLEKEFDARKKAFEQDFADRVRVEVDQRFEAKYPEYETLNRKLLQLFSSDEYQAIKKGEPSEEDMATALRALQTLEVHFKIEQRR
jgi:hypothetical protein